MSVAVESVGFAVSRRTMDPYGNQLDAVEGVPWPDRHGFLNKPVSEATGLTDIGARKYDPATGRFISVDPILDVDNAQQWTGYVYADNNPTTFSDPTGLIANCGPDGDGCSAPNYDNVGADPDNMENPDNWGTVDHGGGFSTAYNYETEEYYIGNYSLGKHSARWAEPLRRQIIKQLNGEYHGSRALYGELDEATMLSQLEVACSRIKDCEREGVWHDVIAHNYGVYGSLGEGILGSAASYKALKKMPGGTNSRSGSSSGSSPMCANSFTGDTPVLMADGTTKRLDRIEVGDKVANSEPESNNTEQHEVMAVIVTDADKDYVDLTVSNPDGTGTIRATAHHLMYNATTQEWTNAAELKIGDELNTPGNGRAVVREARHFTSTLRTYNLSVNTVHTYYVIAGGTPVLVHNDGGYTPAPPTLPGFPQAKRVKPKTSVQRGGGMRARWEDKNAIYEWDSQHGEVEMYNRRGRHLGAFDPQTGKPVTDRKGKVKGPVPGRTCQR
jgi:RHS repeat-associated protein